MGCDIVKVLNDHGISGAKDRDKRPGFHAVGRGATKRQFDVAMAWSVNRLGQSLQNLVGSYPSYTPCGSPSTCINKVSTPERPHDRWYS
jgi:hypothetical protein